MLDQNSVFFKSLLSGVVIFSILPSMIYVPYLYLIAIDLQIPQYLAQLTIPLFLLGACLGQFFWGPFSDQYGRLPILYVGVFGLILVSFLAFTSTSIELLFFARFFQGLFSAVGVVLVRAICRDVFTGKDFTQAIALTMTAIPVTTFASPLIGGVLSFSFGWRSTFLVIAGWTAVIGGLCFYFLQETRQSEKKSFSIKTILKTYLICLKKKETLLLCGCFIGLFGAIFSFHAKASCIFTCHYKWGLPAFTAWFALIPLSNILGLYLFQKLIQRNVSLTQLTGYFSLLAPAALAIFVFFFETTDHIPAGGFLALITILTFTNATVNAGCTSLCLQTHPIAISGTLSALLGGVQMISGFLGSSISSFLPDTPFVMLFILFSCMCLTAIFYGFFWSSQKKS